MNCLLLGAGYVGRAAIGRLKKNGIKTAIYSRSPKEGELKWPGQIPPTFDTCLFAVAPDSPDKYKEAYLDNAKILAKSGLKRIIYTSSTSVYGEYKGAVVTEETPMQALSERAQILMDTEKVLMDSGKDILIFRLGEVIGPGRELGKRLKDRTSAPGTGENRVNVSPLEAIVAGIEFGFRTELKGIFNLVADFHPTRKELYKELKPDLVWDSTKETPHGGNKIVSSQKLQDAGFQFPEFQLY